MIQIEIRVHYLIFWTQIYNCPDVQVIDTNIASEVMLWHFCVFLS